jgi:hypothetical protein
MSAIEGAARTGQVRAYGNEALFEPGTWDWNFARPQSAAAGWASVHCTITGLLPTATTRFAIGVVMLSSTV